MRLTRLSQQHDLMLEQSVDHFSNHLMDMSVFSVNSESILNISTLEAAMLDDIDPDAVKMGLAQYSDAYASATDDLAKSEAEIGVEVYQALTYAINEK